MDDFSEWPAPAKALAVLVAVMLGAVLWSVVASTIFLAGTQLLTADTLPLVQFWQYLHYYGLGHPVVGLWLKIAGGVATALPTLLFVARVARKGWPGIIQRDLHGETRWARRSELVKAGLYETFRGLYVGQNRQGRYLRFGGPEHVACYAPTRSGKGVGLVIPNCLLYESTLVCLDVKKENWAATAGIRAAAGQKVFLFDPLAPDGRTARYNPFSYVRRGTIDAFEDIQRIAQMVFPHVSGDQQFWTDSARSAFTGAAGFLAETPDMPLTFGEVLRLLSSVDGAQSMLERIEARRQQGKPYTEATVKALEDYLKGSADLVNSIRKTITARLSLWFNPRIDAATAESDFDLRELRASLHAIYIGVTPDNIARLRPLLALFFQQLVDLTIRTLPQHDPRAKHQVLMLLDEFPLLGPMPVLADAFAYVAGYNIRLMLIMQSKAQLRDRDLYGPDKAEAILDNCGLEVVFGTKDLKLTEELSARLGYDTVEGTSRSGPRFWRALRRDKLNLTETDQRRALLLPQEIARLKPLEAILIRPGLYPIRCRRIRYFRDRTFTRLLRSPPIVEPIEVTVRLDQGKGFEPIAADNPPPCPAPPPAPADLHGASPPPSAAPKPTRAKPPRRRAKPASDNVVEPAGTEGESVTPLARRAEPKTDATGEPELPTMAPHQSDGLIGAILGAEVDLSEFGLSDGKAAVAAIVGATPTVESLTRGRKRAG
ncbi:MULTISPECIES: type IV secretory system conjugative DNA transfer family protein [Hyphomicrobiales]|jgi:type IV secretion system protein VirD4|uniref:Conjugal transfer protein TraG n=1 Tax=Methylorubrum populi TaxID=223967 RepID=A0A160PN16_9HYPH|nr:MULTISPECIES: type IV secretory system conjugative DNA transfer family protein [Hyphomicrobiales]MDH0699723.1 type IV secretory system conjugative DNA transfer family protein [Agrobacterium sp. GD03871]MDH1062566.1 type IV secretory system conjugative DNA transfer family protein [Agrobacterium sp. GD03992]MDH2228057.1 type IV secretory system conjugative DNA transfer family protein [Agrobacterium sp. GD03642]BAU94183.1 Conjugal transfer protein TraG [Methylorubrum populi]